MKIAEATTYISSFLKYHATIIDPISHDVRDVHMCD